jgi:hypothetical protein
MLLRQGYCTPHGTVKDTAGQFRLSGEHRRTHDRNLCCLVHHESRVQSLGIGPGSPRCKASVWPPGLRHGHCYDYCEVCVNYEMVM